MEKIDVWAMPKDWVQDNCRIKTKCEPEYADWIREMRIEWMANLLRIRALPKPLKWE